MRTTSLLIALAVVASATPAVAQGFLKKQARALGFGGKGFFKNQASGVGFGGKGFFKNQASGLGFGGKGFFSNQASSLGFGGKGFLRNQASSLGFGGNGFLRNQVDALGLSLRRRRRLANVRRDRNRNPFRRTRQAPVGLEQRYHPPHRGSVADWRRPRHRFRPRPPRRPITVVGPLGALTFSLDGVRVSARAQFVSKPRYR